MIYTPLYYDKNNYERKEKKVNGHTWEGRCCPVVALFTMSWWLLPLHHAMSQPPIMLPPQHPISTLQVL